MDELRGLIPRPYKAHIPPTKYEQRVIVNWLQMEVDDTAADRMPILQQLSGHRNIEVFYFIRDGWDWTARLYPQKGLSP